MSMDVDFMKTHWQSQIDEQLNEGIHLHHLFLLRLSALDYEILRDQKNYRNRLIERVLQEATALIQDIRKIEAELDKLIELKRFVVRLRPSHGTEEVWNQIEGRFSITQDALQRIEHNPAHLSL